MTAPIEAKLSQTKSIKLPTAVFAIDAAPDNKHLYAACFDGGIFEVKAETGEHRLLGKHESYASGVQYLSSLNQIVSAGYDGTIRWFSLAEGKQIRAVKAHHFWSWKMRVSPDQKLVASVTGQFLVGSYKYEPAPEREPSVKVYSTETGNLLHSFPHVPPTLSVAFSPDSRYIAAGNMMGEVRVWDLQTGKQVSTWTTPDFTSWGIIKSHHYLGGIFDMTYTPDGKELCLCGMGPMIDPMAGNGKQTWQRFAWQASPPKKVLEIKQHGTGLMETVRFNGANNLFLMAGRLAQGTWNVALFDTVSGQLIHALNNNMRVCDSVWLKGGSQLALCGATSQVRGANGRYPDFGHIRLYDLTLEKGSA
jgi:WD40 repeat protein